MGPVLGRYPALIPRATLTLACVRLLKGALVLAQLVEHLVIGGASGRGPGRRRIDAGRPHDFTQALLSPLPGGRGVLRPLAVLPARRRCRGRAMG